MMTFSIRTYGLYGRQWVWFYLWKWTMPYPRVHRRTIRPVNHARQAYLDAVRAETRGRTVGDSMGR